jgi:hypothetical protein
MESDVSFNKNLFDFQKYDNNIRIEEIKSFYF